MLSDLLAQHLKERSDGDALLRSFGAEDLRELALKIAPQTVIRNLSPGKVKISELDPGRSWLVSSGQIVDFPVGSCINSQEYPPNALLEISKPNNTRLLGVPLLEVYEQNSGEPTSAVFGSTTNNFSATGMGIPYAPDRPEVGEVTVEDRKSVV